LGDSYIARDTDDETDYPFPNKQSTWAHRSEIPNPEKSVTMSYGAVVMLGEDVENRKQVKEQSEHYQSEIIVYDPKQVKIRYIIEIGRYPVCSR